MSNFFQRPLNAGRLHVGCPPLCKVVGLQDRDSQKLKRCKGAGLQGCNGSANVVACLDVPWRFPFQSIYPPAKVEAWQTYRAVDFAVTPKRVYRVSQKYKKKNTQTQRLCYKFSVRWVKRFHSLQTGKPIARRSEKENGRIQTICFHSLQTGKPIASEQTDQNTEDIAQFQFPSNGKVHRKCIAIGGCIIRVGIWFQFPSNGKVHRKHIHSCGATPHQIGFQFPSNGKVHRKKGIEMAIRVSQHLFQFPSNGKVHRKRFLVGLPSDVVRVSIPFKRESASQAKNCVASYQTKSQVSIPFKRESASQGTKGT